MENLVASAVSSFGQLDVMVNNAGIFTALHTIVDETEDEYDQTMAVNAKSVWLGCKFAIRQMLARCPKYAPKFAVRSVSPAAQASHGRIWARSRARWSTRAGAPNRCRSRACGS